MITVGREKSGGMGPMPVLLDAPVFHVVLYDLMTIDTTFYDAIWIRRPDVGPGHRRIIVRMATRTREPVAGPAGTIECQCFTLDRTPFCIKRTQLLKNYEPADAKPATAPGPVRKRRNR